MTGKECSRDSHLSQIQTRPGEAKVTQLLQETAPQYEECMRIADLADISAVGEINHPRVDVGQPDRTCRDGTVEHRVGLTFRTNGARDRSQPRDRRR